MSGRPEYSLGLLREQEVSWLLEEYSRLSGHLLLLETIPEPTQLLRASAAEVLAFLRDGVQRWVVRESDRPIGWWEVDEADQIVVQGWVARGDYRRRHAAAWGLHETLRRAEVDHATVHACVPLGERDLMESFCLNRFLPVFARLPAPSEQLGLIELLRSPAPVNEPCTSWLERVPHA